MKKQLAILAALVIAMTSVMAACGDKKSKDSSSSMKEAAVKEFTEEKPASNAFDTSSPVPADTGTLELSEQSFEDQQLTLALPEGVTASAEGDDIIVKSDDGQWQIRFSQRNTNGWVTENNQIYSGYDLWKSGNPDADDCDLTLAGYSGHIYAKNEDHIRDDEIKEQARLDITLDYGDKAVGKWNGLWITLTAQEIKEDTNIYELLYLRHVRAVLNNFSVIEGDAGITYDQNGLKAVFPSRWDVHESTYGAYAGISDGNVKGAVYVENTFASGYNNSTGEAKTAGSYEYKCETEEVERSDGAKNYIYTMYTGFTDERCIMVKWVLYNTTEEGLDTLLGSNTFASFMDSVAIDPDAFELPGEHTDKDSGFVCDDNGVMIDYRGDSTDVVIPDKIGDIEIKELKSFLFNNKNNVTSIEVTGSPIIKEYAFSGLKSLKSVKINEGVTFIGERAFWEDRALETVEMASTVTNIGAEAFSRTALTGDVTLGDGVYIGVNAFDSVGNGGTLTIGDNAVFAESAMEFTNFGTVTVGENSDLSEPRVFKDARVKSLTIGDGCDSLGDECFKGAGDYDGMLLTLPSTMSSIGKACFYMSNIDVINVPEGVTVIPANCFADCWNALVILPSTLTTVEAPEGEDMFTVDVSGAYLKNSNISINDAENTFRCIYLYLDGVYSKDNAPADLTKTNVSSQVYLPLDANVQDTLDFDEYLISLGLSDLTWTSASLPYMETDLSGYEIDEDAGLTAYTGEKTDVYLPCKNRNRKIVTIRTGAFKDSSLTSIVIPGSCYTIESNAFSGSSSLKDIYLSGVFTNFLDEDHLQKDAFAGLPDDVTVHLSSRLSDSDRSDIEAALKAAGLSESAKFDTYSLTE